MRPASIMRTATTPNQIGLKFKATITGKMTGNVSTIIETESRKQPSTKYIAIIIVKITYFETARPAIHEETTVGIVERARK